MTIYTGPVFEMARTQFHVIADYLDIPIDERDRLLLPKRAITVSCPIHLDDGRTAVFQGYRVQHHLTLGPTKGGTRFAANVSSAMRQLIRPNMLFVVFAGIQQGPRLQHDNV